MHEIVILGGGFAGVGAGISLKKHLHELNAKITLIDRNKFHLFTPSLYEVATSEEPQGNIALPFNEIFDDAFTFTKGTIQTINPQKQLIILTNGQEKHYDYLLLALGSESAYFGIPGLQQYSIPLKTLEDAVRIRDKIKSMCCRGEECHQKVKIVIGGGGFSGTELAAELLTYKDRLAKQHHLSTKCLDVSIIQGSDKLLKELDSHVSDLAQSRVSNPQVKFCFGGHITEVTDKEVKTDNNQTYPYDIFIWTGGVQANSILKNNNLPVNKRGQIPVNEFLQSKDFPTIFAAGDIAEYIDPQTQKPVPGVAQVAEEQGRVAGENIVRILKKQPLLPYHYRHFGYVVPLRGRFAVAELMWGIHIDGFLGWVLQQLVFLRYLYGILPIHKALMKWNKFELELSQ